METLSPLIFKQSVANEAVGRVRTATLTPCDFPVPDMAGSSPDAAKTEKQAFLQA